MASTDDKPKETPVLDYGRPQSDPRLPKCRQWGCALAIATFMAAAFAGVGSDFVRIPAPKKIALTAGVLVVLALLTHGHPGAPRWFRIAYVLWVVFAFMQMLTMWFWN